MSTYDENLIELDDYGDMELISNDEYWSNDSNNFDPKIENQDEN